MINYAIATRRDGRTLVIDIRSGYECPIICECDTVGKAKLIATLLNRYGDDRDLQRRNSTPVEAPPPGAAIEATPDQSI